MQVCPPIPLNTSGEGYGITSVAFGWRTKFIAGLFTLTTVPVLQSPPATPAWKMDTCSVPREKLAKVMVVTPKVPASGPNTLNAVESRVVVRLYGLLGITISTKVALMAADTRGAAKMPAKATVRRLPAAQRIVLFSFMGEDLPFRF